MVKGQEFPVEIYFIVNSPGVDEVRVIGFHNYKEALRAVPEIGDSEKFVDVEGDQTRFTSVPLHQWLNKVN